MKNKGPQILTRVRGSQPLQKSAQNAGARTLRGREVSTNSPLSGKIRSIGMACWSSSPEQRQGCLRTVFHQTGKKKKEKLIIFQRI